MSTWTNERGNECVNTFFGDDRDRYHYDAKLIPRGYRQYDTEQDAWYFGVWVHVEDRVVVTWAEGDETIVSCPDVETFKAELKHMAEFYGDPPPAFRVIDADGTLTHIYDKRPEAP